MSIIQFIKIILKHFIIILMVPVILVATVYYFTKDEKKLYSSETTIYSGLTSGYNLESDGGKVDMFATKSEYDNFMNLLISRETLEEVGIRLFAKHLYLEEQNAKFISKYNYNELQKIIPDEVRDLLYIKNYAVEEVKETNKDLVSIPEDDLDAVASNQKKSKTKSEFKNQVESFHFVTKGETLFSIAKKYNMTVEDLMKLNNLEGTTIKIDDRLLVIPKQNIANESSDNDVEYFPTNTKNIYYVVGPNETLFQVARKFKTNVKSIIIWNDLEDKEDIEGSKIIVGKDKTLQKDSIVTFNEIENPPIDTAFSTKTSNEIGIKNQENVYIDYNSKNSLEQLILNLIKYKNTNDSNFVYELVNFSHPHYSIKALKKINARRVGNSDLVKITYESDDPGITQFTLELLIDVFISKYKLLKENQTDAVVKYFQRQVNLSNKRLQRAEEKLLQFNKSNDIINYYEQTRYIAAERESLDETYSFEEMKYKAAEAALVKLDQRLNLRSEINLASSDILKKRNELADISLKRALSESVSDSNSWEVQYWKSKQDKVKKEIELSVNELYSFNNSVEGMPITDVLTEWLNNLVAFEESKARLKVLDERKVDFIKKYRLFAPLGATLSRIEREIDVAEREYLALLSSLNSAKLRQQNIEFSSNIKAVDKPFFPIRPKPSKRMILIIAAGVVGFVITLFLVLVTEYFDKTIKDPERAKEITELEVGGVFPKIAKRYGRINYPLIINRVIDMIVLKINLITDKLPPKSTFVIGIFSVRDEEGKSMILSELRNKFLSFNDQLISFSYNNADDLDNTEPYHFLYENGPKYFHSKSFKEFASLQGIENLEGVRYIFIEIPSLLNNSYPIDLIKNIDVALIVTRANRLWTDADTKSVETLSELLPHPPVLILNGTKVDALESTIGEIPKHRSLIRRVFKNIIKMQFYTKNKIS